MAGNDTGPDGKPQKPKLSSGGGQLRLSLSDQSILRATIGDRVAKRVEQSHPEIAASRLKQASEKAISEKKNRILSENIAFDPDTDEDAKNLPGADAARKYREVLQKALTDADHIHHRVVIEQLAKEKIPIKTASIQLFAPVAAKLGELWCEDDIDFVQVAVASSRLNIIVNQLVHKAKSVLPVQRNGRKVLLARTSGGNHTLGLTIVAACFDDAGWDVEGGAETEANDALMRQLGTSNFHLLGLSVGATSAVDECKEILSRSRKYSYNPTIRTAVGGPAVSYDKYAFENIGADIIAVSALEAVERANMAFA